MHMGARTFMKTKPKKQRLDFTERGYIKRMLSLIINQPNTGKGNDAARHAAATALKELR
jgi:hypothetical protein